MDWVRTDDLYHCGVADFQDICGVRVFIFSQREIWMFNQYTPQIFSDLDEFDVSRKWLEKEQTKDKIEDLGDVICRHGLESQVGISLLHKHFEMSHDEWLVEKFVGKTSYAVPVNRSEDTFVLPYMWKVGKDPGSDLWGWYPLEFFECPKDNLVEAIVRNESFFADMATALSNLEVTSMFGVSVLHRDSMKPEKGEILLERSNDRERKLNFLAVPIKELHPQIEITQTLWVFKSGHRINRSNYCGFHCTGHDSGNCEHSPDPGCSHCGHCFHCDHGDDKY
jgi:hypothetical protein